MRLALMSNVTVEVLSGMFGHEHSVWTPPGFGAWMETALDPPESLRAFGPEAIFLVLDSSHAPVDMSSVREAQAALESMFPAATVFVPDLEDLADEVGGFYDERMWKLGSMPWSLRGLNAIKVEMERLLAAMKDGVRKVLALDFDGTLWAGVIGEDGQDGIRPFAEFQRGIKTLRERGVLLVGLSRNNASDVAPLWQDSRMVLRLEDFAAMRVDWNDKAENLVAIAKELNVGMDAFVFLDDNPAERERMRAALPGVAVPDFPSGDDADLARFLRRIARLYFPEMRLTDADRRRTSLYREEAARRDFAAGLSAGDYLKGLDMWADVHPVRNGEIARVAQLSQKTNQFNVLTNRYTAGEVEAFAADGSRLLVVASVGDRFGDQGVVAFVHAVVEGDEATIVDWVMSCRAMNRRLEFAVQVEVEDMLQRRGVATLRAAWRRTAKNAPVAGLFDAFGFSVLEAGEDERKYVLTLPRRDDNMRAMCGVIRMRRG